MVDGSLTGPVIGVKLTIQATGERVERRLVATEAECRRLNLIS